jgi:ribosomal protein S12 methylthiotransferase accessory factor
VRAAPAGIVAEPGGVISRVSTLRRTPGEPHIELVRAEVGWGPPRLEDAGGPAYGELDGLGAGLTKEEAEARAVGEALEHYAAAFIHPDRLVVESASGLGVAALPLEAVPRCSAEELKATSPWLHLADPGVPIRWVEGTRLHDGTPAWIPAVMVYLWLWPVLDGERFWMPSSTGCAAHPDRDTAILHGLLECVERDAIAITWLAQVSWPRLGVDVTAPAHRSLHTLIGMLPWSDLEVDLFDATGDLGVPTVYALTRAPHDEELAVVVSAAARTELPDAAFHALLEGLKNRRTLRHFLGRGAVAQEPTSLERPQDGALYMGNPARRRAFDFLLNGEPAPARRANPLTDHVTGWRDVVSRLHERGKGAYLVDLTTGELAEAGITAVRVIVPGLQPVSFNQRLRYLAHPRLAEACRELGIAPPEWNPWPQPFA